MQFSLFNRAFEYVCSAYVRFGYVMWLGHFVGLCVLQSCSKAVVHRVDPIDRVDAMDGRLALSL